MLFNLEPATLVARIIVLAVAFTIHEFAHAWSATQFGDDTPRLNGRLTLNPLAHLDPMGSIVLLFSGFGWAKPVPFNPVNLRKYPRDQVLLAMAGPMANFILADSSFNLYLIAGMIFNALYPENRAYLSLEMFTPMALAVLFILFS